MRRYTVVVDGTPFSIDVEETASDRFEVTVDGQTFEASLEAAEDLPGAAISPELPMPVDHLRTALPPRIPAGTPGIASGSRSEVLAAPMPGVVLEVLVGPGASLTRGDPVLVLEAMKMRNTIRAPHPAVVVSVEVEAGQPVGAGDPLVRLGPGVG